MAGDKDKKAGPLTARKLNLEWLDKARKVYSTHAACLLDQGSRREKPA